MARPLLIALVLAGVAAPSAAAADLATPQKKEIAMRLVSSAENSSLKWREQYRYIEDIHDGRGYTAGIIGFCSGTGDMLQLVRRYTRAQRRNPLARFLPALRRVNGTASHKGLGRRFVAAWRRAAKRRAFRRAQDAERDRVYFNPSVALAKADGLDALGQFAYLEAFLDERVVEMRKEAAHEDVSRIETAQRRFLREGNLDLSLPLRWAVYGDNFGILR
jgi:chitosanase